MSKYEDFLDALCGAREYQEEAIRVTLRYLLGRQYSSLRELARENYQQNPALRDLHPSLEAFYKYLQLPDKLSCALDLATATGKSYVIYGIARIMLAQGAVDQVLALCPSNTIETGLTEKFRSLSGVRTLKDLLPQSVSESGQQSDTGLCCFHSFLPAAIPPRILNIALLVLKYRQRQGE